MDLNLNVKQMYFDAVKDGSKTKEYRLYNDYWKKRLVGREYDQIIYKAGYPPKDNLDKQLIMPYKGYTIEWIEHPHFNDSAPTKVFAIYLI